MELTASAIVWKLLHPLHIVLILLTAIVIYFFKNTRQKLGLPPGPPALPIVGNVSISRNLTKKTIKQLGKTYGDVFSVYIGTQPVLILNSYDSIREALDQLSTMSLIRSDFILQEICAYKGIVCDSLHRRHNCPLIVKAINVDNIDHGELGHVIEAAVYTFMVKQLFGLENADEELQGRLKSMHNIFLSIDKMETICCKGTTQNEFREDIEDLAKFCEAHISEFKDICQTTVPANSLFNSVAENGTGGKGTDEIHMLASLVKMLLYGTVMISSTIKWAVLYMACFPDEQQKVQEELDKYLADNKKPIAIDDKPNLPFTEATLMEVQRLANVKPLGTSHMTTKDVKFRDYQVSKGTIVVPNLTSVRSDPNLWRSPNYFNPKRFLGWEKGNLEVVETEYFVPYSLGRSLCPHQNVASKQLFLTFAELLRHFEFSLPYNSHISGLNPDSLNLDMLQQGNIVVKKRI